MKSIRMFSNEVGADGESLEEGKTYSLSDESADRWFKRNKAELVEKKSKKADDEQVQKDAGKEPIKAPESPAAKPAFGNPDPLKTSDTK